MIVEAALALGGYWLLARPSVKIQAPALPVSMDIAKQPAALAMRVKPTTRIGVPPQLAGVPKNPVVLPGVPTGIYGSPMTPASTKPVVPRLVLAGQGRGFVLGG